MTLKIEDNKQEREQQRRKHAAWLKENEADKLHDARVELVRLYLANPRQWPDGLDLPNWNSPRPLYTRVGERQYLLAIGGAMGVGHED